MKKILIALLLVTLSLAGCGGEKNSQGVDRHSDKKIVIGVDDNFPPICFHNERNELVGFDVDLAKEAANRMNIEIEFKPITWKDKREEITSGNIDMIWNGLDVTEERKEYMIFTKPYMDDRQILLIRADSDLDIHSEGDLEGKVVGSQAGSTSDYYIMQDENLKSSLKAYKVYDTFTAVLEALKRGEVEVLICDELVARYEMNKNPDELELINVKIGSIMEMSVGFSKDNSKLRDNVQTVFDEMVKDGTAKKISEEWFKADLIKY